MPRFAIILFHLFFLLPLMVTCQTIQIQIVDEATGQSIAGAHVSFYGKQFISDSNGRVTLKTTTKTQITISHISYCDTVLFIKYEYQNPLLIELKSKVNLLPEAQVDTRPVSLFAPAKTHVFDFEFHNDSLLVMTYEKEKLFRKGNDQSQEMYNGCKLLLITPKGIVIDSIDLPDLIKSFYKDPLGNIFILAENQVLLIEIKIGRLSLSTFTNHDFQTLIKPLCGNSITSYFYTDYQWDYPEFNYFNLTKNSDKTALIRTIKDEFTMELFRAEYKYLSNQDKLKARRLEYKTGIDKEIFGAYMSGFTYHIYYKKLYAPLFCYGDSLFIFDHPSNQIFFHNGDGQNLDSIDIHYLENRSLKFKDEIINDPKTKLFYGIFEKSGIKSLLKIDPFSGESHNSINLYYAYPENIKVRDNKVYYIYRKTGGSKTRHLFMEEI